MKKILLLALFLTTILTATAQDRFKATNPALNAPRGEISSPTPTIKLVVAPKKGDKLSSSALSATCKNGRGALSSTDFSSSAKYLSYKNLCKKENDIKLKEIASTKLKAMPIRDIAQESTSKTTSRAISPTFNEKNTNRVPLIKRPTTSNTTSRQTFTSLDRSAVNSLGLTKTSNEKDSNKFRPKSIINLKKRIAERMNIARIPASNSPSQTVQESSQATTAVSTTNSNTNLGLSNPNNPTFPGNAGPAAQSQLINEFNQNHTTQCRDDWKNINNQSFSAEANVLTQDCCSIVYTDLEQEYLKSLTGGNSTNLASLGLIKATITFHVKGEQNSRAMVGKLLRRTFNQPTGEKGKILFHTNLKSITKNVNEIEKASKNIVQGKTTYNTNAATMAKKNIDLLNKTIKIMDAFIDDPKNRELKNSLINALNSLQYTEATNVLNVIHELAKSNLEKIIAQNKQQSQNIQQTANSSANAVSQQLNAGILNMNRNLGLQTQLERLKGMCPDYNYTLFTPSNKPAGNRPGIHAQRRHKKTR